MCTAVASVGTASSSRGCPTQGDTPAWGAALANHWPPCFNLEQVEGHSLQFQRSLQDPEKLPGLRARVRRGAGQAAPPLGPHRPADLKLLKASLADLADSPWHVVVVQL